jgi:N-acetylmuramoyl-L-alanine amidase
LIRRFTKNPNSRFYFFLALLPFFCTTIFVNQSQYSLNYNKLHSLLYSSGNINQICNFDKIITSDDSFRNKLNQQKRQNASHFINTIVLDPGHGGDEVGAKGPTGLLEKDVVLDICRILKNILTQKLNVKVYLTRNNDTYIPLEHRIEKANNYKADLFISIHTNASKRRAAKGAESYFLSYEALDKETKELAEFENQGMTAESITPNYDKKLELVLWHMAQAEYLAESSKLAELIQQELNDFLSVEERGIKQAPFLVLMGAQMPAVLVEVAFITNPYEEKMLRSYSFKEKIAQALYQGIANYIQLYNARMSGAAENEN